MNGTMNMANEQDDYEIMWYTKEAP